MTTTRASAAAAAAATTENDFSTPSRTTTDAKPVVTEPQRSKMEQSSGMEVTPPTQQPPTQQQQQHQHEKRSAVTPSESAPRESKEEPGSHAEAVALESVVVNSTDASEKATDSKDDNKGSLLIDSQPGGKHVRFGKEDPDAMDVEEDSTATSTTPTAAIASLTIKVEEGTESHESAAAVTPGASSNNHLGTSSSNASAASQRGLVSRRGGRMGSPSKPISLSAVKSEPVVEYKTYRSPSRKRDENDTIPSLCSTSSGGLTSASSLSTEKKLDTTTTPTTTTEGEPIEEHDADQMDDGTEHRRPSSISCDPSMIDTTSPLASHDETRPTPDANGATTNEVHPPQHNVGDDVVDSDDNDARKQHPPQPNVTFSPPPPPIGESNVLLDKKKTPTRSKFHTLPSLDDSKLNSPGALFLSPHPPTPKPAIREVSSFDKCYEGIMKPGDDDDDDGDEVNEKRDEEEKSSKAREHDRERFVATPTDFAIDYGRGLQKTGSFDASNVLAWLQSPTANGLFSPGGLGSMLNTPRGALNAPRTPRTPTVSTSFFFSDVASLPRGADVSPKPGDPARRSGPRGYSNIICISPLASSKGRNGGTSTTGNTPMNFKDLFASPNDKGRPRSLPLLGDSPSKGMKSRGSHRAAGGDPSLDAVHLAERDLIEDEDLSVLLQLASNTPRSTHDRGTSEGHHVFRHPNNKDNGGENLPSLQLPVIGGRDGSDANSSRLARKTHSREHADADDFAPPPLGIRSSSSGGGNNKEMFLGSRGGDMKYDHKSGDDDRHSDESAKRKDNIESSHPPLKKRKGGVQGPPPPSHYPMHPYDVSPYYPMPGSMPGMPPGGSMRVVVGGPPPPPRGSKKSGSPPRSSNGSPVRPHPYDRPPYPPPYPPHGVYSHHMPPHMGMGVPPPYYPPPHHPPPPRHMMYGSHPPPPTSKSKNNSKKNVKKGSGPKSMPPIKKPAGAPLTTPPPPPPPPAPPITTSLSSSTLQRTSPTNKTKKKSPSKTSSSKKKNRSPPMEDAADREKAAATIAAVNAASGGKNDRAAALAAAILRGVTMRPSGKWQAQLYYAGKSRYIGVFDTREKAALAYEIAREKLKADKTSPAEQSAQSQDTTEAAVNAARKAAFEGVNERDRIPTK